MNAAGDALLRHAMLSEAVASVALSHDADCVCTTCQAASGDEDALLRIAVALSERGLLP